jgi:hypothetical protein
MRPGNVPMYCIDTYCNYVISLNRYKSFQQLLFFLQISFNFHKKPPPTCRYKSSGTENGRYQGPECSQLRIVVEHFGGGLIVRVPSAPQVRRVGLGRVGFARYSTMPFTADIPQPLSHNDPRCIGYSNVIAEQEGGESGAKDGEHQGPR